MDAGADPEDAGQPAFDAGQPEDAGTPAPDAGQPEDAGMPVPDAGAPDAGLPVVMVSNPSGWQFYGTAQLGPKTVLGVTADQGGNIWVAGGEEGVFVLRPGAQTFQRFTLADGLHPYGYLPDGSDVPAPHYLNAVSVSGGPPGVVFVGYRGRPAPAGNPTTCENNFDGPAQYRDPSIYKSGDVDRVQLTASGISVVHYDLFSGPGMVSAEPQGRERLCDIWRVKYSPSTNLVWFGGNHGFAYGDGSFPGIHATGCVGAKYGDNRYARCTGSTEHAHPMVGGYTASGAYVSLSDGYRGIDFDPTGALWIGGAIRSLRYDFGPGAINFWTYEANQFNPAFMMDLWKDAKPADATPAERTDDFVSSLSAAADGTAYVGSFNWGLLRVNAAGATLQAYSSELITRQVHSVVVDDDGSVWVGAGAGGVARLQNGQSHWYTAAVFGIGLASGPVSDLQTYRPAPPAGRLLLVAFKGGAGADGAIGVYSGP